MLPKLSKLFKPKAPQSEEENRKNQIFLDHQLYKAVCSQDRRSVKKTIKQGANPGSSVYPLDAAIKSGNLKILRLLLDSGANPNLQQFPLNKVGPKSPPFVELPLVLAIRAKNFEAFKLLLAYGANPNQTQYKHELTGEKQYPLRIALIQETLDYAELLLKYKAKPELSLPKPNDNLCSEDSFLHRAVLEKNYKVIELLLKYNANVNLQNASDAKSAMHIAAIYGDLQATKILLKAKPNLELEEDQGRTPLLCSIMTDKRKPEVFKLLLESGANTDFYAPDSRSFGKNIPFVDLVKKWGNDDIAQILDQFLKAKKRKDTHKKVRKALSRNQGLELNMD